MYRSICSQFGHSKQTLDGCESLDATVHRLIPALLGHQLPSACSARFQHTSSPTLACPAPPCPTPPAPHHLHQVVAVARPHALGVIQDEHGALPPQHHIQVLHAALRGVALRGGSALSSLNQLGRWAGGQVGRQAGGQVGRWAGGQVSRFSQATNHKLQVLLSRCKSESAAEGLAQTSSPAQPAHCRDDAAVEEAAAGVQQLGHLRRIVAVAHGVHVQLKPGGGGRRVAWQDGTGG